MSRARPSEELSLFRLAFCLITGFSGIMLLLGTGLVLLHDGPSSEVAVTGVPALCCLAITALALWRRRRP